MGRIFTLNRRENGNKQGKQHKFNHNWEKCFTQQKQTPLSSTFTIELIDSNCTCQNKSIRGNIKTKTKGHNDHRNKQSKQKTTSHEHQENNTPISPERRKLSTTHEAAKQLLTHGDRGGTLNPYKKGNF